MIHEFTISNGLKVIGVESHKSPVVSVQIWTRNGSADEGVGDEGLSHFIEHLVFKGTKKYMAGEIAAKVEACGGEINAYTSFDQTVYYITISKQFYSEALNIISDMISVPTFDPIEVDREREVVIEEIKRSQDSLGRRASRLLFSSLYEEHPYSVPVIGYEKNIREVSVGRIKSFFAERYVPENMFLVVTGDFSASEIKKNVETAFAQQKRGTAQKPQRKPWSGLTHKKVLVEEAPFEEAVFYLGWPGTTIGDEDLAALECFALILGQGASSRLYQKLRLESHTVNSIGAGIWAPTQASGFISISGSLNFDKIDTTLSEIRTQLEKILEEGVTEEELQKAKTNFMAEEAYSVETVGGLARKYGGDYEATNDIYFHKKFHLQLEKVTVQSVLSTARKYIQNKNYVMAAIVPKDAKKIENLFQAWSFQTSERVIAENKSKKAVILKKTEPTERSQDGEVHKVILQKTLPLFSRYNNEADIYNLRLAILGGGRVVAESKAGLADLVGRVWSAQTKQRLEAQIREKTDALASSLYSFSGRNTFGLVVDGLSCYQDLMAELFSQTLTDYSLSEEIIEREKKAMLESIRSRKDSPSSIASLHFHKMLFSGHPYGQDVLGTVESVSSLQTKDVADYLDQHLSAQQSVVSLCGAFDEKIWTNALAGFANQTKRKAANFELEKVKPLQKNLYKYESATKEQTHIIYGFHGLSLTDPDRYTLQVLEAVLAGQGGRLFIELRDKASLAYSVSPLRMEGVDTGYFATYIGCSPEKTETAIQMMKDELQKLIDKKISAEELSRAQNYLIGGHDIGLQKNSAIASSIAFNEIYGNSYREIFEYASAIRSVSAEKVQALSQKLFSQKSALSVVGPREPKLSI
jgi:zinc protease